MDINWEIIAASYFAKDIVKETISKVFGPSLDMYGKGVAELQKKGAENFWRVIKKASAKISDDSEMTNNGIPPRVLKGIITETPFCDDEISAEYFGGVLASSKNYDDRGVQFITLISRLSTHQIKAHYFFYSLIRHHFQGENLNLDLKEVCEEMVLYIPFSDLFEFLGEGELSKSEEFLLVKHILFGLKQEGLIGGKIWHGNELFMKEHYEKAEKDGFLVSPSSFGGYLFLLAHGYRDLYSSSILDTSISFDFENDQRYQINSIRVDNLSLRNDTD